MTIKTNDIAGTVKRIKEYGASLGYELETADCHDIIDTGYDGEPLEGAVHDWLNAWETCRDFGGDDE